MRLFGQLIAELEKNLSFFAVDKPLNMDRYQRYSELVICCEFFQANPLLNTNSQLGNILEFLSMQITGLQSDDVFRNLYASYHVISPYASIRNWQKNDHLEGILELVLQYRFFPAEVPPHRQMEWDYLLYKMNRTDRVILPGESILNEKRHLMFMDREFAYGMTHTLFYATDFGFMDNPPPVQDIGKLAFDLECLILKHDHENDVDVALELAINYVGLAPWTRVHTDLLWAVENCLSRNQFIQFPWEEEMIGKKYHSFLVLGILGCLIQKQISNPRVDGQTRDALKEYWSSSMFEAGATGAKPGNRMNLEDSESFRRWQLLKSLASKSLEMDRYRDYAGRFGVSRYLDSEVAYYLDYLERRNAADVLWDREFALLALSPHDMNRMKEEYHDQIQMFRSLVTSRTSLPAS
jgi:hypothetical protein